MLAGFEIACRDSVMYLLILYQVTDQSQYNFSHLRSLTGLPASTLAPLEPTSSISIDSVSDLPMQMIELKCLALWSTSLPHTLKPYPTTTASPSPGAICSFPSSSPSSNPYYLLA